MESDTTSITPRVNFELMQRYLGQRVILTGEVERVEGGNVYLKTSDKATVTVQPNPSSRAAYDTPFVEVLGTVVDPRTIREEEHTNLGEAYDLNLQNELVKLWNGRHRGLFIP